MIVTRQQHLFYYKHPDTFAIWFRFDQVEAVIHQLGAWADNPSVNFTWADATLMTNVLRRRAAAIGSACRGK